MSLMKNIFLICWLVLEDCEWPVLYDPLNITELKQDCISSQNWIFLELEFEFEFGDNGDIGIIRMNIVIFEIPKENASGFKFDWRNNFI